MKQSQHPFMKSRDVQVPQNLSEIIILGKQHVYLNKSRSMMNPAHNYLTVEMLHVKNKQQYLLLTNYLKECLK